MESDSREVDRLKDFTFYYGCASGSSRKALRQLEEPNVFISHATQNNKPWDGIENLFVDSGGAPKTMKAWGGKYPTTDYEYINYVNEYEPKYFALRDYPCEPDLLREINTTVKEHQRKTLQRHLGLIDMYEKIDISSEPVAVIQGYKIGEYLRFIEMLEDHDLLLPYVGIGSVCGRSAKNEIRSIVKTIRRQLPDRKIHGFGVSRDGLKVLSIYRDLDSADSQAYENNNNLIPRVSGTKRKSFRDSALGYLKFKRKINCIKEGNHPVSETNMLEAYS